jgi:hypothetical protein
MAWGGTPLAVVAIPVSDGVIVVAPPVVEPALAVVLAALEGIVVAAPAVLPTEEDAVPPVLATPVTTAPVGAPVAELAVTDEALPETVAGAPPVVAATVLVA